MSLSIPPCRLCLCREWMGTNPCTENPTCLEDFPFCIFSYLFYFYLHFHSCFFLECTPNCKKCERFSCSVCERGYALYKGFLGIGRGRCQRKCPRGYQTEVNTMGDKKCVKRKYQKTNFLITNAHSLYNAIAKYEITKGQAYTWALRKTDVPGIKNLLFSYFGIHFQF